VGGTHVGCPGKKSFPGKKKEESTSGKRPEPDASRNPLIRRMEGGRGGMMKSGEVGRWGEKSLDSAEVFLQSLWNCDHDAWG